MSFALLQGEAEALAGQGALPFVFGMVLFGGLGAFMLRPARRLEDWALDAPRPAPRVYKGGDVLALVGLFVLAQLALVAAYQVFNGALDRPEGDPAPAFELSFIEQIWAGLGTFGLLSAYVFLVSFTREGGRAALGFTPRTPSRVAFGRQVAGVGRYLASGPLLIALTSTIGLAYHLAGSEPPTQEVAVDIQEHLDDHLVLVVLFAVLLQPFFEEVIFRGLLLEVGVGRVGVPLAILLTSVLFGALHGPVAAPVTGFLGAVFAWIKLRTGSLWAPFLAHALHNGAQILLAAYVLELPTPK